MEQTMITYHPILVSISIVLTIIAAFTSMDLLLLVKPNERNKRFLFIGATFSMGIGIWAMHFIGMLAMNFHEHVTYDIATSILSMVSAIFFTGLSFYAYIKIQRVQMKLFTSALLFSIAVFITHHIGMLAMNMSIQYDKLVATAAIILLFLLILFAFWVSLSLRNKTDLHRVWLKPVSSFLISTAIVEAHFLLVKTTTFYHDQGIISSTQSMIAYLILGVSFLIIAGLLASMVFANRRLAASDAHLKDITAALDESSIVAITDPQGKITYVNEKFCEISKYAEHELIGQDHRILNSGYHSSDFFKQLWRTIGNGKVWKGEIRNRAKDGTFYWVHTTIVPFLNRKGKPYQYVSIRTDITDRKRAEQELKASIKELKDIKFALDQSSIVAITDQKGIITSVNDKFCEISKYSRSELIGQDHRILNSGYHSKELFKELWKTIGNGEVWKGEIKNKAKDGSYYWVATTIVPFLNEVGKPYQYLAIRNDITERKKTEEMLHRQDKLAAIGQLSAGVAHEIRNPLTSMRGYAEYLFDFEEDDQKREYLTIILDEINRVNDIVEEFMVLAKPQSVHLRTQNIVPILVNVISLLEFEARKKKVRLSLECSQDDIMIEGDENRLKQVFLNFIKNGIEAMPNGGELRVRAMIRDGQVQVTIQDSGVGIPPDMLKKLGEPFHTTKKNGNGLGLMVSFKIIESHNGQVYVESEVNKGTTFNILLPAKSA